MYNVCKKIYFEKSATIKFEKVFFCKINNNCKNYNWIDEIFDFSKSKCISK